MGLAPLGDQRFDASGRAGFDIGFAEITAVGQQPLGLPSSAGDADILSIIGASCCLSLGACTTWTAITSMLPEATTACAL